MTIPAAWTTALAQPGINPDLWLEIEGIPWAFGMTARAASWFAGRSQPIERRLGVLGLMPDIPRGVSQEARPLDGDSSIGEMTLSIMDDANGVVRGPLANVGRTDHFLYMMAPAHAINTAYGLNDVVCLTDVTPDEWVLRCSTAGTSGAVAPNPAPTVAVGDTVTDGAGTLVWTVIGKSYDLGATGTETFLPYLGTADAAQYPAGGGTIYIGRETLTYTARTAGTNGAGYFSGVTRGMYPLPGRTARDAHTWGDVISPYLRFLSTRRCQVLATLDGTDANRLARWGGTIVGAKLKAGLHTVELTTRSLEGELKVKAFSGQRTAKLYAGIKDGLGVYTAANGSTEPAAETTRVRLVADSLAGTWTSGQTIIVRVGEEYIGGTVSTDATGTYVDFSGTGSRALFSSETAEHRVGEDIVEVIWTGAYDAAGTAEYRFSKFTKGDHPLQVLLSFLLSRRGDGANGAYDILPEGWGIGLDAARVDVAGIERLMQTWIPGQRHLWLYSEPFVLKEEMANLLRPHLCFPVVTLGDLLTVRRLSPPIPAATIRDVTATHLLGPATWDANIRDVIGRTIWRCDWDPIADKSRQTFIGEMQGAGVEAQEFYAGQWQTMEVDAKGAFTGNDPGAHGFFGANLNTNAGDAALRYAETVQDRYARPWPILGVECSYDCLDIEPGDLIELSAEHVPNTSTGGTGLTLALCEVLSKEIDDSAGRVTLSVLQAPAATSRLIAPALPVNAVVGAKVTLLDADLYAAGFDAYTEAAFAATDVVEVWTSNLLTSRGTATVTLVEDPNSPAGGVDLTLDSLPAGTIATDIVMPASYDSATASQRLRYAYLAGADGTLGAAEDSAHLYAI